MALLTGPRRITVMLLGDPRTGKTCFQSAYPVQKQDPAKKFSPFVAVFPRDYHPTHGIAAVEKRFRYTGNDAIKMDPLTVMEMPGDQSAVMGGALRAEEVVEEMREADVFVLTVSLNNPASLDGVRKTWLPLASEASIATPIAVVATHAECALKGASELAQKLAEEVGAFSYAEVSMRDPRNFIPIVNAWQAILDSVIQAPSKAEWPAKHWQHLAQLYQRGHAKPPNVSGYLMKKGHGISAKDWKKRWVECLDGKLYYWKKREDPSSLAGTLELQKCQLSIDDAVWASAGRPAARALVLTILDTGRQYHFVGQDVKEDVEGDLDTWGFVMCANGARVSDEPPPDAAPSSRGSSAPASANSSTGSRRSRRSKKR